MRQFSARMRVHVGIKSLRSGVTRGRTAPGDTFQGVTPELNKKIFVAELLNLEKTMDKRRPEVGVVTRRQLKRSSLCRGR